MKTCSLKKSWPSEWNLSLVLRRFPRSVCEPLKLSSDQLLALEVCFFWLLFWPKELVCCTDSFIFPEVGDRAPFLVFLLLLPRPHSPMVQGFRLQELMSLVIANQDELLFSSFRALRKYLFKGLKAINEWQDDGTGVLQQVAQYPVD